MPGGPGRRSGGCGYIVMMTFEGSEFEGSEESHVKVGDLKLDASGRRKERGKGGWVERTREQMMRFSKMVNSEKGKLTIYLQILYTILALALSQLLNFRNTQHLVKYLTIP